MKIKSIILSIIALVLMVSCDGGSGSTTSSSSINLVEIASTLESNGYNVEKDDSERIENSIIMFNASLEADNYEIRVNVTGCLYVNKTGVYSKYVQFYQFETNEQASAIFEIMPNHLSKDTKYKLFGNIVYISTYEDIDILLGITFE